MNKIGFLEEAEGESSFSRLMILFLMVNSIITSDAVIVAGLFKYLKSASTESESLMAIVLAAGALLTSASGIAMAWKYSSKSQELKSDLEGK